MSRAVTGKNIGIDLDGVGYNFFESLCTYVRRTGYEDPLPGPSTWDFFTDDWGWTPESYLKVLTASVNDGHMFRYGEPIEGFVQGMAALRDAGHCLHIITDRNIGRPGLAAAATIEWLERTAVSYDSITFSGGNKTVATKALDCHVDDAPHHYEALTAQGTLCYIMDAPYNGHIKTDRRVKSFSQFVGQVI